MAATAPPVPRRVNVDLTPGSNFCWRPRQHRGLAQLPEARGIHARRARRLGQELPYGEACVTGQSLERQSDRRRRMETRTQPIARPPAAAWDCSFSRAAATFPTGASRCTQRAVGECRACRPRSANAGLSRRPHHGGKRHFTFNDRAPASATRSIVHADDFNLTQFNYLRVPAERYMANVFAHFDFTEKATGYAELHYSRTKIDQQLTQSGTSTRRP